MPNFTGREKLSNKNKVSLSIQVASLQLEFAIQYRWWCHHHWWFVVPEVSGCRVLDLPLEGKTSLSKNDLIMCFFPRNMEKLLKWLKFKPPGVCSTDFETKKEEHQNIHVLTTSQSNQRHINKPLSIFFHQKGFLGHFLRTWDIGNHLGSIDGRGFWCTFHTDIDCVVSSGTILKLNFAQFTLVNVEGLSRNKISTWKRSSTKWLLLLVHH